MRACGRGKSSNGVRPAFEHIPDHLILGTRLTPGLQQQSATGLNPPALVHPSPYFTVAVSRGFGLPDAEQAECDGSFWIHFDHPARIPTGPQVG
jgi:hypothetical protein